MLHLYEGDPTYCLTYTFLMVAPCITAESISVIKTYLIDRLIDVKQ